MRDKMRIAVISLGHPEFSPGGAETASYNLYQGYRLQANVEDAFYLARIDRNRTPTGGVSWYRGNEFLWEQGMHDWDFLRGLERERGAKSLTKWLEFTRPDVVHAHHYAHLGLEMLRIIRNTLPEAKIFLTLHEYMAICRNNGQMVRKSNAKLCRASSLEACGQCFPETSREDIWLRKYYVMNFFRIIDGFISPSNFLKQRYIEWGLPAEKITVIENAQVDQAAVAPRPVEDGLRHRFGYFGQVNQFKGVDILLQAFEQATRKDDVPMFLEIHGANLEAQPLDFQEKIGKLRETLEERGVLQWVGAYEPEDLPGRMANIDWVVMPSIWWENSPMIIQEAFSCGRPVICSGLGGMAEKVHDGVDGIHVEVGNVMAWATTLRKAAQGDHLWQKLQSKILAPLGLNEIARIHLDEFNTHSVDA
jgi:glycosyltransferase involved in cell wall biosynthesis